MLSVPHDCLSLPSPFTFTLRYACYIYIIYYILPWCRAVLFWCRRVSVTYGILSFAFGWVSSALYSFWQRSRWAPWCHCDLRPGSVVSLGSASGLPGVTGICVRAQRAEVHSFRSRPPDQRLLSVMCATLTDGDDCELVRFFYTDMVAVVYRKLVGIFFCAQIGLQ